MDIAKIRKKLNQPEPEDQPPRKAGQKPEAEKASDTSPEDKNVLPAPAAQQPEPGKAQEKPASGGRGVEAKKGVQSAGSEDMQQQSPEKSEADAEATGNVIEILTFKLLSEDFAFRVSELDEIIRFQHITPVPRLSDYVLGITSLRGKVIPVIDLKAKLSLRRGTAEDGYKKKILIIKGPKGRIGAAVDKVTGVVRIAESELLPPPSHLSDDELLFVSGIAVVEKRFVSILNMQEAVTLSIK
ncbi:MAG: chemotaxis protein CheW [Thermodesulfovibrionales bacterium]|nr:chemotaxis protein CheW [Thermodesulfovibrionales bacterium]